MTAPATQTYTVIGLTLDVDNTELLIAAVLAGPVADQVELLATSEDGLTRWAEEFDAPDPDTAADLAYTHCRNFGRAANAGEYLQQMLDDEGIDSTAGGHPGSGCYWIAVETPYGGEILISGQDRHKAEVDYPLTEHAGWLVCRYDESCVEFTILHDSQSPDLATDTAATVAVVRASLTTG